MEYKYNTNSNKKIIAIKNKLRIVRTWFGSMISIIGLYLAAYNIGSHSDGSINELAFFFVFFLCLIIIVLGGWIIFLANDGERWITYH